MPAAVVTWIADHKRPAISLRIHLVDVILLAQVAVLLAGHGNVDHDDVLQRLRHGVLEDALERAAVVIELQVVHQQPHLLAVAGIAHGLIVHDLRACAVRFGQRAEAAGSVERLVQRAVDLDLFQPFERRGLDAPAVDDRLARIAVLVDQAFGGPRQRVLQDVVRMLGQGADAQLHRAQLVEVTDQLVGGDRDESGCETALGNERLLGAVGDLADRASDLDVFCQIEIMYTGAPRRFRDRDVAVVRQARNHGVDRMLLADARRAPLCRRRRACARADSGNDGRRPRHLQPRRSRLPDAPRTSRTRRAGRR